MTDDQMTARSLAAAGAENNPKIGILLSNLGTPDGHDYWSVRRYLSEFLSDRRVIDYPVWRWQPLLQGIILSKRPFKTGEAYRKIWNNELNESPFLTITKRQTKAVAATMAERHGDRVVVDFCMRYGNPTPHSKVQAMVAAGCTRILSFPLYPQYASATTGTANDKVFRAIMAEKHPPAVRTVPEYFRHPLYIQALAASIQRAYAALDHVPDKLVTTYHGVPKRLIADGDPYYQHCLGTTLLLRQKLGWEEEAIDVTFQSVFGPEEWLRPYTVEHVAELARQGKKRIAIVAPVFSADCLETLEEIEEEIRDSFMAAGGERFTYIPCLNDEPGHIKALCAIIEEELAGWLPPGT